LSGEHYRDQFFYSRDLIAELLPWALDGLEPPARGLTEGRPSGSDPAEGGNVLVMMIDVRRAVAELPDAEWRALLNAHYAGRDYPASTVDELVDLLGGPRT
jgi:hypothetical protein